MSRLSKISLIAFASVASLMHCYLAYAQGIGRIGGGGGGGGGGRSPISAPQIQQQLQRQVQPQRQVMPAIPKIQAIPQVKTIPHTPFSGGQSVQGNAAIRNNNSLPNLSIGGGNNTQGNITTRKLTLPNLQNVKPNTVLRNNITAHVNSNNVTGAQNARIQGSNSLASQNQIYRNSPQHPQHWNNWGQSWQQGSIPAYHRNYYNGAWNGFYGPRWYSGYNAPYGYGSGVGNFGYGGYGLGYNGYGNGYGYGQSGIGLAGFGGLVGLNPWILNSSGYRWGYQNYSNPYLGSGGGSPYNYSQPIYINYSQDQEAASSTQNFAQNFDAARNSFRAGDYERALTLVDNYIKTNPSDPIAHEFRGLTQFALGRYNESAATLNSLLAVAPGWNWATMAGFYPNVDIYTQQLRALEKYSVSHVDEPAPHFNLAYHYLVTGHPDAAQTQLNKVVELSPRDQVAQQLLQGLDKEDEQPKPAQAEPRNERHVSTDAATDLAGNWLATRQGGESFSLKLTKDGEFEWSTGTGENIRKMTGRYNVEGNVLLLTSGKTDVLAATATSETHDQFNFKPLGAPPEDPGLTFKRAENK